MSEKEEPWCFGMIDLRHTEDCSKCEHNKECWILTFVEYQDEG